MPAFLRYIGHRLYTIWATFWFVLPFVVTYPVQRLLHKLGLRRQLHTLNRGWAKFSIFMWGVPVEVVRESAAPAPQPCIYLSNHGSYVDIMLLFRTIPGFLNMMGKDSLARTPLWGPLFASTYVVVNRGSAVARGRSFAQARHLPRGHHRRAARRGAGAAARWRVSAGHQHGRAHRAREYAPQS
jgi:1-acyl-sn-glycerol-3-phosphate acyltransferase